MSDANFPALPPVNSQTEYITLTHNITSQGNGLVVTANTIINLNGHTITFGKGGSQATGIYVVGTDYDPTGQAVMQAAGVTPHGTGPIIIENGTIKQAGNAADSIGIGAPESLANSPPLLVSHVTVNVAGEDSKGFYEEWGDQVEIENSVFRDSVTTTANRMLIPSNIDAGSHQLLVSGTVVEGGNTAIWAGSNSLIEHNVIAPAAFAVNGFGVMNYESTGTTVYRNVIIPISPDGTSPASGRGVALYGSNDCYIEGNDILTLLTPTAEDGQDMRAAGIFARWGASGNLIDSNEVLGVGGGAWQMAAAMDDEDDGANTWTWNTFDAIALSTGTYAYGTGMLMADHGVDASNGGSIPGEDSITSNTFGSNNRIISLYDPRVGGAVQAIPLLYNTLEFIDPSSAVADFYAAALARVQNSPLQLTASQIATIDTIMGLLPTVNVGDQATIYAGDYDATINLVGSTLLNGASLTPTGTELVNDDWLANYYNAAPMQIGVGPWQNDILYYLMAAMQANVLTVVEEPA